ncbi:MAG: hypothetical protein ACOYKN_21875 [Pirellula sp.]
MRIQPPNGSTPNADDGSFDRYAIRPYLLKYREADQRSGYRLLTRCFKDHETLRLRLEKDRVVKIMQQGQNQYRTDRDFFPYYIAVMYDASGRALDETDDAYIRALLGGIWGQPSVAAALHVESASADPTVPSIEALVDSLDLKLGDRVNTAVQEIKGHISERIHSLDKHFDDIRFESVRKLAEKDNNSELQEWMELFGRDLSEKQREIDQLNFENDHLREELSQRKDQIQQLEDQSSNTKDPSDALATMQQVVELFGLISGDDPIIVHPEAVKSAKRSDSLRKKEVFRFLLCLREFACISVSYGGLGKPVKEWFKIRGYEYAQDGESTENKHGAMREILLDGKKIRMKEHVTLFPNNQNCVSIYFFHDKEVNKYVIGYCGNHLKTVSR